MGKSLFGHGVIKCACGRVLGQCRCPEHRGMEYEITNECDQCQGEKPTQGPSIVAQAIATSKVSTALGLDQDQLRGVGAHDLGLLLLAGQVHLLEQSLELARKQAEEFKKALNWARNEFER